MTLTITPSRLSGRVTPPPSKSQAHRVLIAAALAGEGSEIRNLAPSQDIEATQRCLAALQTGEGLLDCGASGSTLRFLIPVALILRGGARFTGQGRLMERPLTPYFDLFAQKGIHYELADGVLTVRGQLTPGECLLPGNVSSQFVSGLLFALPLLEGESRIMLTSELESRAYVDMTLDALAAFGVEARWLDRRTLLVPGGQRYTPAKVTVEADWSQAGFWYAALGLGNQVEIQGLNPLSSQGDMRCVPYYMKLCKPGEVTLDVAQCPDLVPELAAHAALRAGQLTHIVGAARLRLKESDRLSAVREELCKLGAQVEEKPNSLTIRGVASLHGGIVHSHNDHRIAMMLAVAATRATEPVVLQGAESVAKSYPTFWEDYINLGGHIHKEETT